MSRSQPDPADLSAAAALGRVLILSAPGHGHTMDSLASTRRPSRRSPRTAPNVIDGRLSSLSLTSPAIHIEPLQARVLDDEPVRASTAMNKYRPQPLMFSKHLPKLNLGQPPSPASPISPGHTTKPVTGRAKLSYPAIPKSTTQRRWRVELDTYINTSEFTLQRCARLARPAVARSSLHGLGDREE